MEQIANVVDMLEASKAYLWNGKGKIATPNTNKYVCHAIQDVVTAALGNGQNLYGMESRIRNEIDRRIGSQHADYEAVLRSLGIVGEDTKRTKIQAHRVAFIDALKAHFSYTKFE